jgi:hypothetical protein
MKKSSSEATGQAPVAAAEKRVILSMGGKGGVGQALRRTTHSAADQKVESQ